MKYSEKMNSLKKGDGFPLLNFEEGPGVPPLNFGWGPEVQSLNFRGMPGPTFKLWGEPRVPGSWGTGSRGPGSIFTPCLSLYLYFLIVTWNS